MIRRKTNQPTNHQSVSWPTVIKGYLKAPFTIDTTPKCRRGRFSFPWITLLSLDPYRIMLCVKQGGTKYHLLILWYVSTWDWAPVSWRNGDHSPYNTNWPVWGIQIATKSACTNWSRNYGINTLREYSLCFCLFLFFTFLFILQ